MVCGAGLEGLAKAGFEVCLFGVAEDAAREAGEVVWLGEEAANSRDVDDVCADIEWKGEGQWFHFGCREVWGGCEGEVFTSDMSFLTQLPSP